MVAEAPNAVSDTGGIVAALKRAAAITGSNFDYLLATAKRESGLNNTVQSKTSSATGLFQFVDQTWLGLVKEHGAQYGLGSMAAAISKGPDGRYHTDNPDDRHAILALRTDPQVSALMACEFTKGCQSTLEGALGRRVSGGELYAAHFLGADAATKLIRLKETNPDASAADSFPAAAVANKTVFYKADGSEKSVGEVYSWAMKHVADINSVAPDVVPPKQAVLRGAQSVGRYEGPQSLLTGVASWRPTGGFFSTEASGGISSAPWLLTPGIFDVLSDSMTDKTKKQSGGFARQDLVHARIQLVHEYLRHRVGSAVDLFAENNANGRDMGLDQRQRQFAHRVCFLDQLAERRGSARDERKIECAGLTLYVVAGAEQVVACGLIAFQHKTIMRGAQTLHILCHPVGEFGFEAFHRGFGAFHRRHVKTDCGTAHFCLEHVRRHEKFNRLLFGHGFSLDYSAATEVAVVPSVPERRSGPRYSSAPRRRRQGPK